MTLTGSMKKSFSHKKNKPLNYHTVIVSRADYHGSRSEGRVGPLADYISGKLSRKANRREPYTHEKGYFSITLT